jgi:hypothetical protein
VGSELSAWDVPVIPRKVDIIVPRKDYYKYNVVEKTAPPYILTPKIEYTREFFLRRNYRWYKSGLSFMEMFEKRITAVNPEQIDDEITVFIDGEDSYNDKTAMTVAVMYDETELVFLSRGLPTRFCDDRTIRRLKETYKGHPADFTTETYALLDRYPEEEFISPPTPFLELLDAMYGSIIEVTAIPGREYRKLGRTPRYYSLHDSDMTFGSYGSILSGKLSEKANLYIAVLPKSLPLIERVLYTIKKRRLPIVLVVHGIYPTNDKYWNTAIILDTNTYELSFGSPKIGPVTILFKDKLNVIDVEKIKGSWGVRSSPKTTLEDDIRAVWTITHKENPTAPQLDSWLFEQLKMLIASNSFPNKTNLMLTMYQKVLIFFAFFSRWIHISKKERDHWALVFRYGTNRPDTKENYDELYEKVVSYVYSLNVEEYREFIDRIL